MSRLVFNATAGTVIEMGTCNECGLVKKNPSIYQYQTKDASEYAQALKLKLPSAHCELRTQD